MDSTGQNVEQRCAPAYAGGFSTAVANAAPQELELQQAGQTDLVSQRPAGELVSSEIFYRTFERLLALAGLIVAAPVMALVAASLLVQGQGSIFYSQVRVGKGGRKFSIYKFRTMFESAEAKGPFICTSYEDPRITPLGRVLRKSKLDELPQLLNVIKGEMALVGPRPERPCFHEKNSIIPGWEDRIDVLPGVTGIAQISRRISHDPEQKLKADLIYIENRNALLDFKLLVYTALPLVRPERICGVKLNY